MTRLALISLCLLASQASSQTLHWEFQTDTCVTVSGAQGQVVDPCGFPWLAGCRESTNDTSTFIGTGVTFQEANQCYNEGIVTSPWGPLPGSACVAFHFASLDPVFLNGVVLKYRSDGPQRIRVDLDGEFLADLTTISDSLAHDTAFVVGRCVTGSALVFRPYNGTGHFIFREVWLLALPCLPTSVPERSTPSSILGLWYEVDGRQLRDQ